MLLILTELYYVYLHIWPNISLYVFMEVFLGETGKQITLSTDFEPHFINWTSVP